MEAMRPFFSEAFGSAGSLHEQGLRARDALATARDQVAAFVNAASPEEIIFTSDGTESANLAIQGTAWANQRRGNQMVISAAEHPAVLGSVEFLEKRGFVSVRVGVNREGCIDPNAVREAMTDKTILVGAHLANHDVGTIQPVSEISALTAGQGATLFVDAEAAAGWMKLDVQALGAGLLSFSPHKFYGPKGVGVLYRHRRARLVSLLHGGVQEGGFRGGVENVPAIVGAGAACEIAGRELSRRMTHVAALQRRLWEGLSARVPHLKLNGPAPGPARVGTNLNVSFEFVEGEGLMLMLDTQGISVTSGMSCVSRALKVSPVLTAMGIEHTLAQGSLLLSPGKDTTGAEIDFVLETLPRIVAKLRGMSPQWDEFQRGSIKSVL
ncbi:MAG: cysteine desulfurase [Verrucomicrobiota bacterium]